MAPRDTTFSIAMQKDSRGPSRHKCATDIHVTAVILRLWYQTPSCVYTTWHQPTTWIHHLTLEYETHGSSPLRVGSQPRNYKHATSPVYSRDHISAPMPMWHEGKCIIPRLTKGAWLSEWYMVKSLLTKLCARPYFLHMHYSLKATKTIRIFNLDPDQFQHSNGKPMFA